MVCIGQESGRFSAVVKGSRAPRSRVGGLLEPPVELQARLRQGRSLEQLTQPRLSWAFAGVKRSLDRLMTAGFLARLFLACLPEGDGLPGPYELLRTLFEELESGCPVVSVGLSGQDRLLCELGLAPHLENCLFCGESQVAGFSAQEGGVVCGACYSGTGFAVSAATHQALKAVRLGRSESVAASSVAQVGRVYKAQFQQHLGLSDGLFKKVLPRSVS